MTAMTDVERELRAILADIDAERAKAEARRRSAQEVIEVLDRKWATIQSALDIYLEHHQLPTASPKVDEALREKLAKMTVKQMIIALASENTPAIFRVVDMNRRLVQAGMFKDEAAARDSVYPTLGRNPKVFIKVAKGQYLVSPAAAVNDEPPASARPQGGLRDTVAAMTREHPEWTRQQVAAALVAQGWNFGGRKPVLAVGACFASLKKQKLASGSAQAPLLKSVS